MPSGSTGSRTHDPFEDVDSLFRPDPESDRRARECAEIAEYMDEQDRLAEEARRSMSEAELREEAAVIAEQERCRQRARRRREDYEAELEGAAAAGRRVPRPHASSRKPHRLKLDG